MADEIRRDGDAVKGSPRAQNGDSDHREGSERLAQQPIPEHRDPTGRDDTDARERQSRR